MMTEFERAGGCGITFLQNKIQALQEKNQRLRDALREYCIEPSKKSTFWCGLCFGFEEGSPEQHWKEGEPEIHKPECLAAKKVLAEDKQKF